MINKDCALMLDSMHIKSRVQLNKSDDQYEGFVDFGEDLDIGEENNNDTVVTEALVFMPVGLRGQWKFPVGYFLVNKVNAEVQSRLIQITSDLTHQHTLVVHSITCDCTSVKHKTMSLLGWKWLTDEPSSQLEPTFTHGTETHLILDACHLL